MPKLEMSVTPSVVARDVLRQRIKLREAREQYEMDEHSHLSKCERLDILRTERRILYYMECAEGAFDWFEDGAVVTLKC